jgi:CheY-like chemotaxis protein
MSKRKGERIFELRRAAEEPEVMTLAFRPPEGCKNPEFDYAKALEGRVLHPAGRTADLVPIDGDGADEVPATDRESFVARTRDALPPELTEEWLAGRVKVTARAIRLMHEKRERALGAHPDFAWPARRPTEAEFAGLVFRAVWDCTAADALRTMARAAKVDFEPLGQAYRAAKTAALALSDETDVSGPAGVVAALARSGQFETAMEIIVHCLLTPGQADVIPRLVSVCGEQQGCGPFAEFLEVWLCQRSRTDRNEWGPPRELRRPIPVITPSLPPPPLRDTPKQEMPQTMTPSPVPAPAQSVGVEEARRAWERARDDLARLAAAAAAPSREILERLEAAMREVRAAAEAVFAFRPDTAPIGPLLDRVASAAAEVRRIGVEVGTPALGADAYVLREALDGLEALCAALEEAAHEVTSADQRVRQANDRVAGGDRSREAREAMNSAFDAFDGAAEVAKARHAEAAAGLARAVAATATALAPFLAPAAPAPEPSAGRAGDAPAAEPPPAAPPAVVPSVAAPEAAAEPKPATAGPEAPSAGDTAAQEGSDVATPVVAEVAPGMEAQEPPSAEEGGNVSEAAEALLELLGEDAPDGAAQPAEDEAAEQAGGDEVAEVERQIEDAFALGDFALAHHLTLAAVAVFGESPAPYSAAELALAATARTALIDGGVRQAAGSAMAELLSAVSTVKAAEGRTRALAASASAVIPALLRPDRVAIDVLSTAAGYLPPKLSAPLRRLGAAAADVAAANIQLTAGMLRAASGAEAKREEVEKLRTAIHEAITAFGASGYNFKLGVRVQERLYSGPGSQLNRLKSALDTPGGIEAAKSFAEAYRTREGAAALVHATVSSVEGHGRDMHGAALDRMCQRIMAIAEATQAWADTVEAGSGAAGGRLRDMVSRIRTAVLAAAEEAGKAALEDGSEAGVLLADVLADLRRAFSGEGTALPGWTAAAVLHGRLAWMPGLDHGTGWLPQPYDPEAVLQAAAGPGGAPLPGPGPDRDALFLEVSRIRRERGAFAGARLLLDCADAFAIGEAALADAREDYEADLRTRRDSLRSEIGLVRGLVEHLQRMGVRTTNEGDAQTWLLQLDALPVASLPLLPPVEELGESQSHDAAATDFSLAEQAILDIESKVDDTLAGPRRALQERVEAVLPEGQRAELLALLESNELVTVSERLAMAEAGHTAGPDSGMANRRFDEFFPAFPEALGRLSRNDLEALRGNAASGTDFERDGCRLAFSRIPETRRAAVQEIMADWAKLRLQARQAANGAVLNPAVKILNALGFQAVLGQPDPGSTDVARKIFAVRVEMSFPRDTESFLLPDFGSRAGGSYRLVVAPSLPEEGKLTEVVKQDLATIVLVPEVIDGTLRRAIARASLATPGGRKVLVIDEAVLLYALTEPELRPLTLLELAQPFSRTQPFGDYGRYSRVPEEMFVGRREEYDQVIGQRGACIVYGGRRLGKTALLRHVENDIAKTKGSLVCAYVPLDTVGSGGVARSNSLWERISAQLGQVFTRPVRDAAAFSTGVRSWINGDRARRILVLLDEADNFVEEETGRSHPFLELNALIELMDSTERAFKFVLAGLHNVARFARFASLQKGKPNPPIGSLDGSAQRIGPLLGKDTRDAEALVVRTMAAMGWRFERREDVWAVLSHTNYYPVLAQTFCEHLLDTLADESAKRGKVDWVISSETVYRVLASDDVRKSIREKFEFTINELDPRYQLITLIAALEELRGREGGEVSDGLDREHIQREALYYWPKARALLNDQNVMDELLGEMEGLGVLRRARADRWAIRSPAVLALLGTRMHIEEQLLAFQDREAARPFDPQALRRDITIQSGRTGEKTVHFSPFTVGQEERFLEDASGVVAVFGPPLAEPENAVHAIAEVVGPMGWTTSTLGATTLEGFRAALRTPGGRQRVMLVTSGSAWGRDWADEALRAKPVRDGTLRVVFIGGVAHALRWEAQHRAMHQGLRTETLGSWAPPALDVLSKRENIPYGEIVAELGGRLGGWNKAIRRALRPRQGSRTVEHLRRDTTAALKEVATPGELGIDGILHDILADMRAASGEKLSDYYLAETMAGRSVEGCDASALRRGLVLAGLAAIDEASRGKADDLAEYDLNPLVLDVLARHAAAAE